MKINKHTEDGNDNCPTTTSQHIHNNLCRGYQLVVTDDRLELVGPYGDIIFQTGDWGIDSLLRLLPFVRDICSGHIDGGHTQYDEVSTTQYTAAMMARVMLLVAEASQVQNPIMRGDCITTLNETIKTHIQKQCNE